MHNVPTIKEKRGWMGDRYSPVISDQALAHCRQVLTDERLEYLGDRYRRLAIRYWTGVDFHKYLLYPEALDAEADRKRKCMACTIRDLVVTTTN